MNKVDLIEDFIFVANTIKSTHPLAISGFPHEFNEYINKFDNEVHDKDGLIMNLSRYTALLHDGHTNIEVEYSLDDLCVNLPCVWLKDGLFATGDYFGILKGDKIISIAKLTINEVMDKLCEIIPHENTYLVKVRATTYPFINYHIFSEFVLHNIGALNCNSVEVTVLRNNQQFVFNLTLEKYNGFLSFKNSEKFIDFLIYNNVAILKIDECKYNDVYMKKLNEFFMLVKAHHISSIIIDLRENMGGSASVVTEFLKHIAIDSYYFYGVKVRNENEDKLININSEKNCIINKNDQNTDLFNGKIICLVSNKTFSSARIFATVLKDNNVATILGEPTGGKPCSYGNPLRFETPNFKIKFRVSSRIFTRPSQNGHDEIALFPDVPVYPTIKDVINKDDIVLGKALMLVKEMK